MNGGFVCETDVIRRILTKLINWATYPTSTNGELSAREIEVLNLVAKGRSNKEIALEIVVSEGDGEGACEPHESRMERRAELVRYALTSGLVESEAVA
jgi:FixJ family two-component response regulator